MTFDLVPVKEIPELLASHVSGPYRFVQHAMVPYVRVGPSTETEPITITSSGRLKLLKSRSTRLTGLKNTMDFTVTYDDAMELHLVQTPFHATQLDPYDGQKKLAPDRAAFTPSRSIHLGAPVWENSVEGGGATHVSEPGSRGSDTSSEPGTPAPKKRVGAVNRSHRMTPAPVQGPDLHESPICDALRDLAVHEELEPVLGDYLVIPVAQAQQYAPLPRWAATSKYVDCIHVVKPRLGMDTPIHR